MDSYAPLSGATWAALQTFCTPQSVGKGHALCRSGEQPDAFWFVYTGLFRVFVTDEDGREYNKIFFDEGTFPGSMAALLTATPSRFTIESLEPSVVIGIDFRAYRKLLFEAGDLMRFHIAYLEKHWLLAKDAREVALVQEDAAQRYQRFLSEHPTLNTRLPQYHIASHLGITPTQLSRIRKKP